MYCLFTRDNASLVKTIIVKICDCLNVLSIKKIICVSLFVCECVMLGVLLQMASKSFVPMSLQKP